MTDIQMLRNSFCEFAWYRRTKDLVPLLDSKVHFFKNSLLKILAHLRPLVKFELLEIQKRKNHWNVQYMYTLAQKK